MREQQALTLEQAVRMPSFDIATRWGFADRGLNREGMAADLVVFDPETVLLRDGKPTGALPGQLVRGPLARRS